MTRTRQLGGGRGSWLGLLDGSYGVPPNWLRMAAIAFIAGDSSWREENGRTAPRRWREAARRGRSPPRPSSGLLRSPLRNRAIWSRLSSSLRAWTSRSSSQDRITVPSRQRVEDLGHAVHHLDLLEQLPAFGVGLHDAYSMPLWTILAKCPAPILPACTKPSVALGFERVEDRLECRHVVGAAAGTSTRIPTPTQTPPETPQSMKPIPFSASSAPSRCRRSTGSCRRRPRRHRRPAAR